MVKWARGAVAAVWLCGGLSDPATAQERVYRIGTVSGQLDVTADSFRPFTDYLSSRIPDARFEMVPLPTIEALLKAADEQRLDFAFSTPVAFVELNTRHRLRPIATVTQLVGGTAYPWLAGAVFVRRSRTDIQRLEDVRGQRVIALSPLALGGWLSAVREWRRLGIDPQTDAREVRFVFSYAKVVEEVCAGTADIGVISASTLNDFAPECPGGLRVLPSPSGARDPRYPTDVSTDLYPEAAFAVVGDLDERLVTTVTLELLSIAQGSDVAKAATVAGFTAPLSYTPVQQLMEQLRIGPYEGYGRLTFTQAVEQHAGKVLLVLLAFLSILTFAFLRTHRLNRQLELSIATHRRGEEERARLEAQLHQSQRMDSIGRLAGAVAHDFNNLLTVINGYSEMLLGGADAHEASRHSLTQIHKAGRRAAELAHQLLTFSKKQISRPVALDLNTVVREAETMFRRLLREDIRLVTSPHSSPWLTMADPGQMHQVLMNLVVNARDAMPTGGTLSIATDNVQIDDATAGEIEPGAYAVLSVSDTGVGMDTDTRQHIFEPFFSTKGAAGTGLGLSTVYGIVRQSQGTISVSSQPGIGTTFTILLPRTEQQPEPAQVSAPAVAAAPSGSTILIVEDQDEVRGFAIDVLRQSGYRVLEASSGGVALTLGDAHPGLIHLLLTDVVLSGMNGRELSERFRTRHPETLVLFTSGYADDVIALRGVQQGSIAFLPKPYSAEGLQTRVREVLGAGSG